jgi:hypothetical protein
MAKTSPWDSPRFFAALYGLDSYGHTLSMAEWESHVRIHCEMTQPTSNNYS